ncbi:hypothetical protein GJ744_005112 [Endocarpon pusillum]|uniref:Uncharacterized protein n=1 Tax=Endocarpon pusillum TaxID=364733 RepID=A0A8H7AL91_9EURO|nr:hypothetical protein GJ744_005112 [Endocarpon pusillum]
MMGIFWTVGYSGLYVATAARDSGSQRSENRELSLFPILVIVSSLVDSFDISSRGGKTTGHKR